VKKIDESELIAYHLRELSPLRMHKVRAALERDATLAAESEEIAGTLREFSGGPAPIVDEAMLERSWQSVRPSLTVLTSELKQRSWRWAWMLGAGLAAAAVVLTMVLPVHRAARPDVVATHPMTVPDPGSSPTEANAVIEELNETRGAISSPRRYNNRPGPLTTMPAATDPALAAHLDSAERLLTQVSHQDGPLPVETRREVHHLLLQNALYRQAAQSHGDLAEADVMDDLGRVLTSLDAAPPETASSADSFRLEMNVGGVLFDLRILKNNKSSARE
jgi:hypothetical protein